MSEHKPMSAAEAAAYATGPEVRPVKPGSNSYLLHEMQEVKIDASVILNLVRERGTLARDDTEPPTLQQICRALWEADTRLFIHVREGE